MITKNRFRKKVKGYGKIIPKSINLDGQNQPIKTYEQISIDNNGIKFNKRYDINIDYVHDVEIEHPSWKHTGRYNFALAGAAGGRGGAATNNAAVSRIEVMDPHLLVMMRDVMDSAETAGRLHPQGQATGGGGGGGGSSSPGDTAADGGNGGPGIAVNRCIRSVKQGEGGNGGQGDTTGGTGPQVNQFPGGGGGGGAGGGGGVVVICTTTASGSFLSSNVDVSGGAHGDGGTPSFSGGSGGSDGDDGKDGTKLWIQV